MTTKQARSLEVGSRVRWAYERDDETPDGTVVETGTTSVVVKWDGYDRPAFYLFTGSGTAGVTFLEKLA